MPDITRNHRQVVCGKKRCDAEEKRSELSGAATVATDRAITDCERPVQQPSCDGGVGGSDFMSDMSLVCGLFR